MVEYRGGERVPTAAAEQILVETHQQAMLWGSPRLVRSPVWLEKGSPASSGDNVALLGSKQWLCYLFSFQSSSGMRFYKAFQMFGGNQLSLRSSPWSLWEKSYIWGRFCTSQPVFFV